MGWRNLFSSCAVGCVSFWFWQEIGFGSNTHVLLRVQYSCGGVLVFWLQWEIVFGVLHILSVQYSCADGPLTGHQRAYTYSRRHSLPVTGTNRLLPFSARQGVEWSRTGVLG
jgi:hypothetical protein